LKDNLCILTPEQSAETKEIHKTTIMVTKKRRNKKKRKGEKMPRP